jgi:hypothetical protein
MDINTLRMPRIALKIPRLQGRVSSNLTFGTNDLRDFAGHSLNMAWYGNWLTF